MDRHHHRPNGSRSSQRVLHHKQRLMNGASRPACSAQANKSKWLLRAEEGLQGVAPENRLRQAHLLITDFLGGRMLSFQPLWTVLETHNIDKAQALKRNLDTKMTRNSFDTSIVDQKTGSNSRGAHQLGIWDARNLPRYLFGKSHQRSYLREQALWGCTGICNHFHTPRGSAGVEKDPIRFLHVNQKN
jgi:hypothetical protein